MLHVCGTEYIFSGFFFLAYNYVRFGAFQKLFVKGRGSG